MVVVLEVGDPVEGRVDGRHHAGRAPGRQRQRGGLAHGRPHLLPDGVRFWRTACRTGVYDPTRGGATITALVKTQTERRIRAGAAY